MTITIFIKRCRKTNTLGERADVYDGAESYTALDQELSCYSILKATYNCAEHL